MFAETKTGDFHAALCSCIVKQTRRIVHVCVQWYIYGTGHMSQSSTGRKLFPADYESVLGADHKYMKKL